MIDLHIHTKYSDGSCSLKEVLSFANNKNLEVISITDHNNIDAYYELKALKSNIFKGKIITGVELNTSILGYNIEVLVYNFDIDKMQNLLNKLYMSRNSRNILELNILYNVCMENDIALPNDFLENFDSNGYASEYLLSYLKNIDISKLNIDPSYLIDFRTFYRKCISEKSSIFFINPDAIVPSLDVLILEIRKTGGLIFLAHPFIYKNYEIILEKFIKNYDIDGLECFHSTFSNEQIFYLNELCKENKLSVSGGSDFHGKRKPGIFIGNGYGDLAISQEILNTWRKK